MKTFFVDSDFRDHKSIAGEYMGFLVHCTNSTEVSTFQPSIHDLKERINDSKKD